MLNRGWTKQVLVRKKATRVLGSIHGDHGRVQNWMNGRTVGPARGSRLSQHRQRPDQETRAKVFSGVKWGLLSETWLAENVYHHHPVTLATRNTWTQATSDDLVHVHQPNVMQKRVRVQKSYVRARVRDQRLTRHHTPTR